ncbi:MAG: NAD(P)(+) transhydrogenase (Re/Si-specific) subunit beta [Solirubrobacterales bacterium]
MSPLAVFLQDIDFIRACYIVAVILFIYGVQLGTHPTTARRGNGIAAVGMAIAVAATLLNEEVGDFVLIIIGLVVGTLISIPAARRVKMTAMPQMVALFNGLGGGAVALIAWSEFRNFTDAGVTIPLEIFIPILLSMVVGSISFWGSNIAFGKLQELLPQGSVGVPGQQIINAVLTVGILVGVVVLALTNDDPSELLFVGMLIAAAVLGNLVVLPIGGADMPVVISLLNAFTGLAAAAAGFALDNLALIVAGTLVGSSGTILTLQMAEAMNRSVNNILFSGFGGAPTGGGSATAEDRPYRSTSAADAAIQMAYATQVVVVPGYGMAVAQAQHVVREMADELEKKGVDVDYAIHPVAGRMPGHMNVLLAEADVPYENLKEMDEINGEFPRTDVALVIGANDVTNPAANDDPDSPIYGMPILNVHEAQSTIVLKRSMSPGFAGIDNELYYLDGTAMLFGDAKASVAEIVSELGNL